MAVFHVIGDADTVLGFRYAGLAGKVVEGVDDARRAFLDAAEQRQAQILIITDIIADGIRDLVDQWRASGRRPLVVEIPSAAGPSPTRRDLMDLIRQAVGIRL